MSAEIVFRDHRPGEDDERIRHLLVEVFGSERGPDYWHWKYCDNPAGAAVISLAELQGRIVSMACAVPLRMLVGGQPASGSVSVEACTAVEVRGRGVYTKVARRLYERLSDTGVLLTYGFTNRNSTGVTLEVLGRREVRPFPLRVRLLRPLRLLTTRLGLRNEAALRVDQAPLESDLQIVHRFDASWDPFWESIAPQVDIGTIRDGRYLNWRYADHPERAYEILAAKRGGKPEGYIVWRLADRFGVRSAFVLDFGEAPEAHGVARRLLDVVSKRAKRMGAGVLTLLSWPGGPFHRAARGRCRLSVPRALFPQPITFSVISHGPAAATDSLAHRRRWWLGWGDTDLV